MTLEQLKAQREALQSARFNGALTVKAGDKLVTYKLDAELQSTLSDLDQEIARAEGRPRPLSHPQQWLCRQCSRILGRKRGRHRRQALPRALTMRR